MRKVPFLPAISAFIALLIFAAHPAPVLGQGSSILKEGIDQYNRENYEEAIETLTRARVEDPSSADAAFFLGMAYRQTNDILNAYRQFSDAVNLKPLSDNAILEMIEVSTLVEKLDVAKKWIAVAEEHKVYPARVAFLKGAALAKEQKYDEAIAAFEKSKQLDPTYAQSADFQIGVCYMNMRKYARAHDLFQSAITKDPLSDMASYARRYQEAAEQWRYIERPLRLTIDVMGQYDTNYRTLPDLDELATSDRRSLVMQNTVRLDFVPVLPAPFVFNAGYAALNTLHEKYGTDNDILANSFTVAPGVNYENFAVNLVANYTHTLKRDPSYRRYSEISSVGPLFRYLASKNHILDASVAFTRKNFFKAVGDPEHEDQTSRGMDSSVSWMWLFKENALFNLRLGYTEDNAEGSHYDNQGYRTSLNLIYPLLDTLRLQVGGEIYLQNYRNENVVYNIVRKDRLYTGTVGLTWAINKHLDLIALYLHTRADSNIYVYDYDRDVLSFGMELKF